MREFLRRLKQETIEGFSKKDGWLAKTREVLGTRGVNLPITGDMLLWAMRRQKDSSVQNVDVSFAEETVIVSGMVRKMGLHLYGEIEIRPLGAEGRVLYFQIERVKPLDFHWFKQRMFSKQPGISYEEGVVSLNLNELPQLKAIPVGTIRDFFIKNEKLWIRLGL